MKKVYLILLDCSLSIATSAQSIDSIDIDDTLKVNRLLNSIDSMLNDTSVSLKTIDNWFFVTDATAL